MVRRLGQRNARVEAIRVRRARRERRSIVCSNLERVREGTGDKVGMLVQFTAQFVAGSVFEASGTITFLVIPVSLWRSRTTGVSHSS